MQSQGEPGAAGVGTHLVGPGSDRRGSSCTRFLAEVDSGRLSAMPIGWLCLAGGGMSPPW